MAALGLVVTSAPSAWAGTLYGVGQVFGEVYAIDTDTGLATPVGSLPEANFWGIAFDGDGVLHGLQPEFSEGIRLWELDADAGSAILIGPTGSEGFEGSLAFDPATSEFLTNWATGDGTTQTLVRVDPASGLGSIVGNMGLASTADISGLALTPAGVLYGYDTGGIGPSELVEIDPVSGLGTVVGAIGDDPLTSAWGGLAFDGDTGTLYMSNAGELWEVDTTTGAGTLVGSHGIADLITGLTVLPDPPSTCLLGVDLLSTLWDVDPLTGATSNPRPLAGSKFGGLAVDPFGELFGMRAAPVPELYAIDPASGSTALIGSLGIAHSEGGLDFDPTTGELFGVGGVSELFTLDIGSGAATVVGALVDEVGDPIDPSAMAFDALGNLFVLAADTAPPELYEVDPSDGSVLSRVPLAGLPASAFGGMDFDDSTGQLHLAYGSALYVADPVGGGTVLVGGTGILLSALEVTGPCEPAPEPPRGRRWRRSAVLLPGFTPGG